MFNGDFFKSQSIVSESDIADLTRFNEAVKGGTPYLTAIEQEMSKSSETAKNLAKSAKGATVNINNIPKASKAAAAGMKALSVAGNMLVSMGVAFVITKIIEGIQWLATASERAKEAASELADELNNQKTTIEGNISTISGLEDEFKRLSKGVDDYGANISLSADEYERYQQIVQQIVGISPSLISGYNKEGSAIANKNGLIEQSIELLKEENRQRVANATSEESIKTLGKGKIEEYKDAEKLYYDNGGVRDLELDIAGRVAEAVYYDRTSEDDIVNMMNDIGGGILNTFNETSGIIDERVETAIARNAEQLTQNYGKYRDILEKYLVSDDLLFIDDTMKTYSNKYSLYISKIESAAKALNPTLQTIPQSLTVYDELSDKQKVFISEYVNTFRITSATTKKDIESMRQNILEFTQAVGDATPETKKSIEDLFSLDKTKIPAAEWEKQVNDLINQIVGALNFDSDEDKNSFVKNLKIRLGIEFATDGETTVDTMIANNVKKFSGKFEDEISKLQIDDLKILSNLDISPEGIEDWSQVETLIANAKMATGELTVSLDEFNKEVDEIQDAYSTLKGAVDEYNNSGYMSLDTVQKLLSLEPQYLAMLVNENGQLSLNEQAMRDLLTARLEETKAKIYESGINQINALTSQKTGEASEKAADKKSGAVSDIEDETKALNENTEAGLRNAASKAVEAGASKEEIDKIVNNTITSAKALESAVNGLKFDFGGTVSGKKSGGSDKNEALDNYLKDAENRYKIHQDETKYIQELQSAYDNLTKNEKERLDITGKINEAYRDLADNRIKDIEHQIDLAKESNEYVDVTDYYKQIQNVAHEEANRLRAMGYDDNSNEIQDLQKTWWDAQNKIADESYSNSERWISERNTYNDWELYGDNEIAAWERVLKRFKTEFPNELEKIKEIEQNIFEARKEAMEKSIDDIEDYIDARNTYNDWDAYGDSEVKAIRRQTKIIEDAYRDRLLSYEEYIDKLEEQSKRIYSLGQDQVDKHLSNIDKYIDARNHYNDWDDFNDSEIESIKRQCEVLDAAYRLNLISLEDYTERSAELTQKLYSVAKENIIETISELVEEYEEMKQFESSQLESQKTLLQSYYDVSNAISDAQHEINKELEASMTMHEYLNEETRELLFNQEDYNALNAELLEIQSAADELQKQYQEDILNANAETIAEITSQYQMQYETMMKQYEIAKAELEVAKKRQKLDNVLAERNTRMFINGQWQWVAKTQDVINAQNELAEAEIEKKKQEASLEQTEAINDFTEKINSLETDLNKTRKWWSDMQEMLNGESEDVAEALRQISEVSSPELKRVINITGGSITSFSTKLSESTATMSDIIDGDRGFGTMADSISTIITDLGSYSDAIKALINKINSDNNTNSNYVQNTIAEMKANSQKWFTASEDERRELEKINQEKGASIGANYDSATGKWYDSNGNLLYSVSSSSSGSSSSSPSKGSSSSSSSSSSYNSTATKSDGTTVNITIDSNGNTLNKGLSTGTVVHTSGGDYKIVSANTSGATYNPGSGYWSIKVNADGSRYTSGGLNLMGEEGFEAFISNKGRLIPITQPTLGNIGAGGIVFNREQMASLRNLWDWSNIGKISPSVSSSNTNKHDTIIDNSIHINGLAVSEQGNEDWINGLRRYVATHK